MAFFDTLQQASFGSYVFPVEEVEVTGGIRDHIHEYPHAEGGAPEKLGRKLYTFRLVGNFQATFAKYPNLYPLTLNQLQHLFEDQTTDTLVVPTIGSIQAYARSWKRTANSKIRSGEKADFEFVEDQSEDFLVKNLVDSSSASLGTKIGQLQAEQLLAAFQNPRTGNLFDSLQSAVNSYLAVADQVQLAAQIVAVKVAAVIGLCTQCDDAITNLEPLSPQNVRIFEALHDVWDGMLSQSDNLFVQQDPMHLFVVPSLMAIQDVSTRIYGDATHCMDLLNLNPIEDAFSIPAGTQVRFYEAA